jgi:transposase
MTMQLEFTPAIQDALNYERYHHPMPLVQRRMEALWLKSHGLPHGQIAQLVNITENTLRDYFQLYLDGGVERLKEVALQGPESELVAHYASLEAYFRAHPPATIKEAQSKIAALTGIKRSETQVREFLKKTPSPLPPRRDAPGQSRPRPASALSGTRVGTALSPGPRGAAGRLLC